MASSSTSAPRRRSLFRPCIDLHDGLVKQIVGGTLRDANSEALAAVGSSSSSSSSSKPADELRTNHTSTLPPSHFAELYRRHGLQGAHVIKLGPNNDRAAREALSAWPGGLQVGGGLNASNAAAWLDGTADAPEAKASKVIVTSHLFPACRFSHELLRAMERAAGGRERLVVDISCRKRADAAGEAQREARWVVAMNKWQDLTDLCVNPASLALLAAHCSEFLIHAADVEGLCQGIDEELVRALTEWMQPIWKERPDFVVTYAGGARHLGDMQLVDEISHGRIDVTFGSALDIFGGKGVTLKELVDWNQQA